MNRPFQLLLLVYLSFVLINKTQSQEIQTSVGLLQWGKDLQQQINQQDSLVQEFENLLNEYQDHQFRNFSKRGGTILKMRKCPLILNKYRISIEDNKSLHAELPPILGVYYESLSELDSMRNVLCHRRYLPTGGRYDKVANACMERIQVFYSALDELQNRLFEVSDQASDKLLASMTNGEILLHMKKETQMMDELLRSLPHSFGQNVEALREQLTALQVSLLKHQGFSFLHEMKEDQQVAYETYLWTYNHKLLPEIEGFIVAQEKRDIAAINSFLEETYLFQWDFFDYAQVQFSEMAKSRYFLPMIQTSIEPSLHSIQLPNLPTGSP